MNKKLILIIPGVIIIAIAVGYWAKASQKDENRTGINREAQLVLFYGELCPHCKDLEKFIEEKGIKQKVDFLELEVSFNKKNGQFLLEKAEECDIPEEEIGVPFLYAGENVWLVCLKLRNF